MDGLQPNKRGRDPRELLDANTVLPEMEESIKCATATDALHSSLFKHETPYAFSERLLDHVVDDFISTSRKSALEAIRRNSDCVDAAPTEYAVNERLFILLDALGHMDQSLWNQMATNYIHRFNSRGVSLSYFLQSTYAIYVQAVFSRNPDGTRNTVTCDKVVDATRFMVQFLRNIIGQVFVCTTAFTDLRQAVPRLITTQKCIRFALQTLTQNVRVTRQIDHAQDPIVLQMESEANAQQAHTYPASASYAGEHVNSYSNRERDGRCGNGRHQSVSGPTAAVDARSECTSSHQSGRRVRPDVRAHPPTIPALPSPAAPRSQVLSPAAPAPASSRSEVPSPADPAPAPAAPRSEVPPPAAPASAVPPLDTAAAKQTGTVQTPRPVDACSSGTAGSACEQRPSSHSPHDRLRQIATGGPPVFQFRFRSPDAAAEPKKAAAGTPPALTLVEPGVSSKDGSVYPPADESTYEPEHDSKDDPVGEASQEGTGATGVSAFGPSREHPPDSTAIGSNTHTPCPSVAGLNRAASSGQQERTMTGPLSTLSPTNPPSPRAASMYGMRAPSPAAVRSGSASRVGSMEKDTNVLPAKTVAPAEGASSAAHKRAYASSERVPASNARSNRSAAPTRASAPSTHALDRAASTVVIQPSDSISEISADRRAALHHTLCRDNWSEAPQGSVARVSTGAASQRSARDNAGSTRTTDRRSSMFLPPIAP